MATSSSSSLFPASFIVHKRYILPTLLLVAAVVVGGGTATSAEEREILREPHHRLQQEHSRQHRLQQPLVLSERPAQAQNHRRRHHAQREPSSSSSRAPSTDFYGNSTTLDGAHRRRDANLTVGQYVAPAAASAAAAKTTLRVLSLNTWGLNWPFSEDKWYRVRALRNAIALNDYDVILLQEVWFRRDYDIIRSAVPYASYFESFNQCSGYFLPMECSGLVILSRHRIEHVEFLPFRQRGSFWNFDGEIFVGKGVGKARILWNGLVVDVFTSHFVSYTNNPNSDNKLVRFLQSKETVSYIQSSDADIKLFGADINALPTKSDPRMPYYVLSTYLRDSLLDRYPGTSFHPAFATYGNRRNSYTRAAYPERIDLLMFRARPGLRMRTENFLMPIFATRAGGGRMCSLSDHEALLAEYVIEDEGEYRDD